MIMPIILSSCAPHSKLPIPINHPALLLPLLLEIRRDKEPASLARRLELMSWWWSFADVPLTRLRTIPMEQTRERVLGKPGVDID